MCHCIPLMHAASDARLACAFKNKSSYFLVTLEFLDIPEHYTLQYHTPLNRQSRSFTPQHHKALRFSLEQQSPCTPLRVSHVLPSPVPALFPASLQLSTVPSSGNLTGVSRLFLALFPVTEGIPTHLWDERMRRLINSSQNTRMKWVGLIKFTMVFARVMTPRQADCGRRMY